MDNFILELQKMEPIEVLGVAKILRVQIVDEKNEAKDAMEILNEMTNKFMELNRTQKRNLLRIMRATHKRK